MSNLAFFVVSLIKCLVILFILLTAVAYIQLAERKIVGRMQARVGPTRVGPFGLLQPAADAVKFILKEDVTPDTAHKFLYLLAPALAVVLALLSITVIPWGGIVHMFGYTIPLQITDINVGLLLILGVTSLGVYGIVLAGWSSNSKYSLLGALRGGSQMISYELALGLALIGPLILGGTLSLRGLVDAQTHIWFIVPEIVAFFIYLCAAFAETNRIPFDLPEAEGELGAGYHTEYSAMKFAMFFLAEYVNMITVSCVATIVFLGGWMGPLFGPAWLMAILPTIYFLIKVCFFLFLYIWVRGTLPRYRYDQLMAFGWKVLVPLALANVLVTSLVVALQ
ncbi:MAG: NADH-quinone oxidoreductase subunit NuoH [Acidobacteria bacterium]|nr:MAG: NADH-quinone oxidoreductase subunit NuoH [Acidobacteriota bacterium]